MEIEDFILAVDGDHGPKIDDDIKACIEFSKDFHAAMQKALDAPGTTAPSLVTALGGVCGELIGQMQECLDGMHPGVDIRSHFLSALDYAIPMGRKTYRGHGDESIQ